ncbi:protein-glutamate methylesterase [Skermanella aerolata]|uniref:histidine kinase n=2 Tax=Skermanella aerolata TaxID=393310 RepID=A0A512DYE4_9PROT|nr:protein-glutamate methylesterase [Skermanella aerolata]
MPDGRKHLENDCLMSGTPSNPAESVPLPSHALPTSTGETGDALDFSIVGIGASAGGLDACRKFADALPAGNGMAFILVQHLDPTHESMMVDLLADNTPMTVVQAVDGMPVERDHFYVIPPGTYLSVAGGALRLSEPLARHGARLPFDFLLHSLAEECGERAVCVILSGTGADGSLGLKSVKELGGLVIAQDPAEAAYDGMPRSAIATGLVDIVLAAADIPRKLVTYDRRMRLTRRPGNSPAQSEGGDWLPAIIEFLRTNTPHDFTLYKQGTLRRRTERRMAMAAIEPEESGRYLDILKSDPKELDLLAKDLLINVTSFFRDGKVFDLLAEKIVPGLVAGRKSGQPLRIWSAGCSSGEETYSLSMLFHERIAALNPSLKLQVFASDVDPDAIAYAREGLYPETIDAEVSPERLKRFFTKEDHGYRVTSALRESVVFTVQDVLADPPFSRLDFISCRNLLIYLGAEAQAKVISLFHFALHEGGLLLLGNSETIGAAEGRFEVISKQERLYRRNGGHGKPAELGFAMNPGGGMRMPTRPGQGPASPRPGVLAELCQRLVIDSCAPATVLINRKYECLYFLGPTDAYLQVSPDYPMHDIIAMARDGVRTKLRQAIQRASHENTRIVLDGGKVTRNGDLFSFSIAAQPVSNDGEEFLLICFIDGPKVERKPDGQAVLQDVPRVHELERELEATRRDLQDAIHNFEVLSEEQKAINEEALSVNEEYQSTNEELLTSKEELQSLNEELTALNTQLHETLERQRTASNDLQNVLYSSEVATLFLDMDLNIRFFTPATKSLFRVISSDIGRPLADLKSISANDTLMADAAIVLRTQARVEQEIETLDGSWYIRRVMPYRTQEGGVEGVVVTFVDITERKRVSDALVVAKQEAEQASAAKSRFLAAASHDLRQPLQTLTLLQGLLGTAVEGDKPRRLLELFEATLAAMSGMLNTLLDINQIDAGMIHPDIASFPVSDLLDRLKSEFTYHAQAQGIDLRVVRCGATVRSDRNLLAQIIRNLLANAFKYTRQGKVLLGCRRREGRIVIEVWDTGIGIPEGELQSIFEEYRQLDNAARERKRGMGLGLSIVQRLGNLMGHRVGVRSWPGRGSVFSIEVELQTTGVVSLPGSPVGDGAVTSAQAVHRTGKILVVEDDSEMRDLLELILTDGMHRVTTAPDGVSALKLAMRDSFQPDLMIADYNLPNGMDGLTAAVKLRQHFNRDIPVIIMTGDISTDTLRSVALERCVQLHKPVTGADLLKTIQRMLANSPAAAAPADAPPGSSVIFVVEDDNAVRAGISRVLEEGGHVVESYADGETFLDAYHPGHGSCLLLDANLPGMSGFDLLERMSDAGHRVPAIMVTGNSDVRTVVHAMKAGASDFIEKPVSREELLASVRHALEESRDEKVIVSRREKAVSQLSSLTERQRQIMDMVLDGHPSKNIAADLGISQRTVENHRAEVMRKTGTKSLPALARLALAAARKGGDEPAA